MRYICFDDLLNVRLQRPCCSKTAVRAEESYPFQVTPGGPEVKESAGVRQNTEDLD